jgi:hypothetical protein
MPRTNDASGRGFPQTAVKICSEMHSPVFKSYKKSLPDILKGFKRGAKITDRHNLI